jgi:metal-responsive CopG/Arc/MetJ family transcriptional regulator
MLLTPRKLDGMKLIQISLDDALLAAIEEGARKAGTSRAAFIREAVAHELGRVTAAERDARYREGYQRFPIEPAEFDLAEGATSPE